MSRITLDPNDEVRCVQVTPLLDVASFPIEPTATQMPAA